MSVHAGLLTVEEFLKLPDPPEGRLELHHGEVVVMPPPKRGHQRSQNRLQGLLQRVMGTRYVVEKELAFRPSPEHEVWVADVGSVSMQRDAATDDDEYLAGAPELVIEVLSPSNTVDEINDKMLFCMANGCVSFWVIDPKRRLVSVTEGNVTRHYGEASPSISCALFKEEMQLGEIFEG
jgi:Uma2 family endonuclease